MKKIRKVLCLALTSCMLFSSPVYAEDNVQEIKDSTSAQVQINLEVSSTFTVAIPLTATLDPATGRGSFPIKVKGNIAATEVLTVEPIDMYTTTDGDTTSDVNFLLHDTTPGDVQKDDLVINIINPVMEFDYTEITEEEQTFDCSIETANGKGIPSGTWSGIVEYNITLTDV